MKAYVSKVHYSIVCNGYQPTEKQQIVAKEMYRNQVRRGHFPHVEHLQLTFSQSGQAILIDLFGEGDDLDQAFHGQLHFSPIP